MQNFAGMARWDGTSFATPFVAGLVAGRIAAAGDLAPAAAQSVLTTAEAYPSRIPGLDRVVRRDFAP